MIFLNLIFLFFSLIISFGQFYQSSILNSFFLNFFVFSFALFLFFNFRKFPRVRASRYVFPISLFCIFFSWLIILIFRVDYSIKVTFLGNLLLPILLFSFNEFMLKQDIQTLYLIPSSNIFSLKNSNSYKLIFLDKPHFPKGKCDGFIIDFNDFKRPFIWERFIVDAAFKKVPIYSYNQINEMITGKVNLVSIEENDIGGLRPSLIVSLFKRIFDLLFILFMLPIIIPLGIVISLAIILDSPGKIFFIQQRVGLNGKPFNLIKFRSMASNDNKSETKHRDSRITRVGSFIRKARLDEIPQFVNVLLGDMSLIGPRPETLSLVREYEKIIPFFMYRHIVKPGISGWAQVMLGYTVGSNEKKEKLAYDLYYIKHYSIYLELFILFKTIKTIFTGAGAK
jgi:lipopolysaccharide/colanic/teichoic acid biosynthesis glycosyltransferase